MQKRIFHYTVGAYLPSIIEDKQIKLATAFVPKGERPAVWCSTNSIWEETANKMYKTSDGRVHCGNKEDTYRIGKGLIRIEVTADAVPYTWADFKRMRVASRKMIRALEEVAKIMDGANPDEWRIGFEPIPFNKWLGIEYWDWKNGAWLDIENAFEDHQQSTPGGI